MAPGPVAERSPLAPRDSDCPRWAFPAEDWRWSASHGLLRPASGSPEGGLLGAGLGRGCPSSGPAPALAQVRSLGSPWMLLCKGRSPLYRPSLAVSWLWSHDGPRHRTLPLYADLFLHLIILI